MAGMEAFTLKVATLVQQTLSLKKTSAVAPPPIPIAALKATAKSGRASGVIVTSQGHTFVRVMVGNKPVVFMKDLAPPKEDRSRCSRSNDANSPNGNSMVPNWGPLKRSQEYVW